MRGYLSESRRRRTKVYKAKPPVTIPGARCVRVSDKAAMVMIRGQQHWMPQSAIHAESEVWKLGDSGNLVVAHWWAARNGFK